MCNSQLTPKYTVPNAKTTGMHSLPKWLCNAYGIQGPPKEVSNLPSWDPCEKKVIGKAGNRALTKQPVQQLDKEQGSKLSALLSWVTQLWHPLQLMLLAFLSVAAVSSEPSSFINDTAWQ